MERRKALAAASAATLILGSTVVAGASMTGASFLGFGGSHRNAASFTPGDAKSGTIVKTRNIYDKYVVETGAGASGDASARSRTGPSSFGGTTPASTGAPDAAPGPDGPTAPTTPATEPVSARRPPHDTPRPGTDPTPATEPADGSPATTVAPTPTSVPTTTTTWPPGVPADWPKDKPIPPMPPNCAQPQLEDNGVWNCDH